MRAALIRSFFPKPIAAANGDLLNGLQLCSERGEGRVHPCCKQPFTRHKRARTIACVQRTSCTARFMHGACTEHGTACPGTVFNTAQYMARHGTPCHGTTHYSSAHGTVHGTIHGTARHSTAHHSTGQHGAAQHGAAQHGAAHHHRTTQNTRRAPPEEHSTSQHITCTAQHSTAQHILE